MDIGQPMVDILGPLEAVEDQSLSIVCIESQGGASAFLLREDNVDVTGDEVSSVLINNTHQEFTIDPVMRSDDNRSITCSIEEVNSRPLLVTVFCKLLW